MSSGSELCAGIAFAASRGDALAPTTTLLSVAASPLLSFLTTREASNLRAVCVDARAAVAEHPWADHETRIQSRLEAWRASFPRSRVAFVRIRLITDAAFEHLRGIRTLQIICAPAWRPHAEN